MRSAGLSAAVATFTTHLPAKAASPSRVLFLGSAARVKIAMPHRLTLHGRAPAPADASAANVSLLAWGSNVDAQCGPATASGRRAWRSVVARRVPGGAAAARGGAAARTRCADGARPALRVGRRDAGALGVGARRARPVALPQLVAARGAAAGAVARRRLLARPRRRRRAPRLGRQPGRPARPRRRAAAPSPRASGGVGVAAAARRTRSRSAATTARSSAGGAPQRPARPRRADGGDALAFAELDVGLRDNASAADAVRAAAEAEQQRSGCRLAGGVRQLCGGAAHSMALAAGGSVWVWGDNSRQLGIADREDRDAPALNTNAAPLGVVGIAARATRCCCCATARSPASGTTRRACCRCAQSAASPTAMAAGGVRWRAVVAAPPATRSRSPTTAPRR